jgi:hypothetical protein
MRAPLCLLSALLCAALVGCASVAAKTPAPQAPAPEEASPALPVADDLTFGNAAGTVLIGLTVLPAKPGPNVLLIYVAPKEGPSAAASVPVSMTLDGQPVQLTTCASSCRTANVSLGGGEHLEVTAGGPAGGIAFFDLPGLPAPSGGELLQQLNQRMHELQTYKIQETLGPASPPLSASYVFSAPDRMQLSPSDGNATIWIGPTRYSRDASSGAWRKQDFGTSPTVPSFIWDLPPAGGESYVGAHVVGSATVAGVDARELTFFMNLSHIPVWFQLWVDADGLVRQASMRAQDHFMDHTYTDFDAAVSITPPV